MPRKVTAALMLCSAALLAMFFISLDGCKSVDQALDQAAPQFAPQPATTQPGANGQAPTTVPAVPRNVAGELATVGQSVAANPSAQGLAGIIPYGGFVLGAIGLVSSTVLGWIAATHKASANTAQDKLQVAHDVIAAAAPGVMSLVQQATKNPTVNGAVALAADDAEGVLNLISHPSAAGALALAAQDAPALISLLTPAPAASAPRPTP